MCIELQVEICIRRSSTCVYCASTCVHVTCMQHMSNMSCRYIQQDTSSNIHLYTPVLLLHIHLYYNHSYSILLLHTPTRVLLLLLHLYYKHSYSILLHLYSNSILLLHTPTLTPYTCTPTPYPYLQATLKDVT